MRSWEDDNYSRPPRYWDVAEVKEEEPSTGVAVDPEVVGVAVLLLASLFAPGDGGHVQ